MLINLIFAAIPHTEPWGVNTALVMIGCNSLAIATTMGIVKRSNLNRPPTPTTDNNLLTGKDVFKSFNSAELLAAMSLGHILGVGVLLGLTNVGII